MTRLTVARRAVVATVLLFSAASAVAAQTAADDIKARVREGDRVWVTDDQGREFKGRINAMTSDGLNLLDRERSAAIKYAEIIKIDRPHDGLKNGALIGLAAGAGLGFLAILAEDQRACDPSVWFDCSNVSGAGYAAVTAVFAGLGAAVGTGVDAIPHRAKVLERLGNYEF